MKLEGQWEVVFSDISHASKYQGNTEGKITLFDTNFKFFRKFLPATRSLSFNYHHSFLLLWKPRTRSFKRDTITQKLPSKSECLEERKKVEIHFANESSGLASFSTDLSFTIGSNAGNDFGVLLRGKGPPKPLFVHPVFHTYTLVIDIDLIEHNIVGDTKAPLLRCFLFNFQIKIGDIITTGQYMNHQTFSNLQTRPLLKLNSSFHSFRMDLRDTSGEKTFCFCL